MINGRSYCNIESKTIKIIMLFKICLLFLRFDAYIFTPFKQSVRYIYFVKKEIKEALLAGWQL